MTPTYTSVFTTRVPGLGAIPGPLRIDVIGTTIWLAGGYPQPAVLRYTGEWEHLPVPHGLSFIVALGDSSAIAGGYAGNVGRTDDGGRTWTWSALGGEWLICGSRDPSGDVWIGQQGGRLWRSRTGRTFDCVATLPHTINAVKPLTATTGIVLTERALYTLELASGTLTERFENTHLIDAACDERGRILVVGNKSRAWFASDGRTFAPISLGDPPMFDYDLASCVGGQFCVIGYDGTLRISSDCETWTRIECEPRARRLSAVAPYRQGWLVGSHIGEHGGLGFLGDPARAPRHELARPSVDTAFAPPPGAPADERERGVATLFAEALAVHPAREPRRVPNVDPELAAQLDASDDDSVFAVLADVLQRAGDPRGEIASIQLHDRHGEKELQKPARTLHQRHATQLLGRLESFGDVAAVTWRGGFFHKARIANNFARICRRSRCARDR